MSRFGDLDDTPAEVQGILLAGYRRMTPTERWGRIWKLTEMAQQASLARLRAEFPAASERELRLRLAELTFGGELIRAAFDWVPAGEDR